MGAAPSVQADVTVKMSGYQQLCAYNIAMAAGQKDLAEQIKPKRENTLMASPGDAKFKLAVVQFKVPGAKNGGSDKGPDGNRIDSIPIANSVINAGAACDLLLYDAVRPAPRIPGGYALAVATPARC